MKNLRTLKSGSFLIALLLTSLAPLHAADENWKGKPYNYRFQFSGLAGMGILNAQSGFQTNITASAEMLHNGFFPDVNNQTYMELGVGPLLLSTGNALAFNIRIRWDFHYTEIWSFFALGGFGGAFSPNGSGGTLVSAYPSFGLGVLWNVFEHVSFRGEISHEFIGLGVMFSI
jgi:hypothetical protein